jgi:hypothetical protein
VSQVFVKQWNGATWDLLPGPNPVGSLNVGPAISAGLPVLAYVGTIPYVVWAEGSQGDLYVYRWNGAVWEPVGGKLNSLKTREHAWMTSDGATVYVSWAEEDGSGVYQAYVAQWNGADWVRIGGSLNVDAGKEVHSARVAVATDGTVYSAWAEKDGSSVFQFYARRWDGSSWILEGGSLNVDPGQDVSEPHLAVNGNVPYAAWAESGIVYVKTLP